MTTNVRSLQRRSSFDPRLKEETTMTRRIFTCTDCGSEYTSAWAVAYCCDPAAPGEAD